MMASIPFTHRHAGHCESGVISSLLRHRGLEISEPMVLGLSAALTFAHFPFIKVGGLPLTSYRMPPGFIYRGLARRLGFRMQTQRFRHPEAGAQALDEHLRRGQPVGVQTSVFWLPYFPPAMRFHFNAHNLIVFGKEDGEYLVSDPVFEHPQRCPAADLEKARFVKGLLSPKGLIYFPEQVPASIDLPKLVPSAIRRTVNMMLRTPLPFIGVGAMRRVAAKIAGLQKSVDPRLARLYVGQIVRMQEEIGTGGGGFRFMYAAFLQEAGEQLHRPHLVEASAMMTETGDAWREFASVSARYIKDKSQADTEPLARALTAAAGKEEAVYRFLLKQH